jgi:hypothetical protein
MKRQLEQTAVTNQSELATRADRGDPLQRFLRFLRLAK